MCQPVMILHKNYAVDERTSNYKADTKILDFGIQLWKHQVIIFM